MSGSFLSAYRSARRRIVLRIGHQHDSELLADCIGLRKDLHDLLRSRVGSYVVIGGLAVKKKVADASSGEISSVAARTQGADNLFGELSGVWQKALCIQHSALSIQ